MKSIIISIFFVAILGFNQVVAQKSSKNIITSEFAVSGVCNMCKERIEEAALIKGVKWAEWDKNTQEITVIYKAKKVDLDAIQKAISEAGHDTEKYPAEEKAYDRLPGCCSYKNSDLDVH